MAKPEAHLSKSKAAFFASVSKHWDPLTDSEDNVLTATASIRIKRLDLTYKRNGWGLFIYLFLYRFDCFYI